MPTTLKRAISNPDSPLFAIYGPGRSGTTWIGSIINSHPDIAYRFEPFRHQMGVARVKAVWDSSQKHQITMQELHKRLYDALLPAHALVDKPPFFYKKNTRLRGHKLAWNCARKFPVTNALCEKLYTTKGSPPIVFKEVRWNIVKHLLERLNLPSIFVLRSPHGTISSQVRGQKVGLMPTWQCDNLEQVIAKNNLSLIKELPKPLGELSIVQKNAIIWRINAENMFDYLQQHPDYMLLLYEDLCTRTLEVSREVFEYFDIPWHQQTESFIKQSTSNKPSLRATEKGINSYFSVARDTTKMVNRWSKDLSNMESKEIYEIVEPSLAYQAFLKKGLWE